MKIRGNFVFILFLSVSCLIAACSEIASSTKNVNASGSHSGQTPTATIDRSRMTDIKPGRSLGPIALGDSFDLVLEVLPFKKNTDQVLESRTIWYNSKEYVCPKEYHWLSLDGDPRGEFYYFFENDRAFQIESRSGRYKLENGLGVGSKLEEVLKVFPDAERFKIDFGQPPQPGYDEEIYLVYQEKGLAFQITSEFGGSNPEVTMVIIFPPERDFLPRGCVTPPAKYIKAL
jgi:hypothetical protein